MIRRRSRLILSRARGLTSRGDGLMHRLRPDFTCACRPTAGSRFAWNVNPADAEGAVTTRNLEDWTVDRWKVDAKFPSLELDEPSPVDQAPPLWKDLTLAVAGRAWAVDRGRDDSQVARGSGPGGTSCQPCSFNRPS